MELEFDEFTKSLELRAYPYYTHMHIDLVKRLINDELEE